MRNCKNFKIYKFRYNIKNFDMLDLESRERIREYHNFKMWFINMFSGKPWMSWAKDAFHMYTDPTEDAIHYMETHFGIHAGVYWGSWCLAIPISRSDMIEWVDRNVPKWTEVKKRI